MQTTISTLAFRLASLIHRHRRLGAMGLTACALVGFMTATESGSRSPAASYVRPDRPAPNIIFILSDDMGWTGTSVAMNPHDPASQSDYIETPNLERLAQRGMRFSNAYSPAAMCSPTRSSLQYGKSPARLMHTDNYMRYPEARKRIGASLSLPKMLQQTGRGYVTAHLGKWHQWPDPGEVGYDVHSGATDNPAGNALAPGNRAQKTQPVPMPPDDPKRIFSLSRQACAFMAEQVQAKRPFYLQISHYAVHKELMSLRETAAKYEQKKRGKWERRAKFAACTEDLDTGIGMVLNKLKELGIEDTTYVIFMSDNGALAMSADSRWVNMPLRRGKFVFMEGGIRVPMLVAGPGIPANSHSAVPVWGCDLWPTIHDLAGAKSALPKDLDGGSLLPLFENGGSGEVRRDGMPEGLIFHCPEGAGRTCTRRQSAMRSGDFKLMKNYYNDGEVLLFNVQDDPHEWHDLSARMPKERDALLAAMEGYLKRVDALDARMTNEELAAVKVMAQGEYRVNSFPDEEKDPQPYGN